MKHNTRTASILCSEPSEFLSLKKTDYFNSIGLKLDNIFEQITNFLHSLPFLAHFPNKDLEAIAPYMNSHKIQKNQFLIKEKENT